jgi:hypothetical protein
VGDGVDDGDGLGLGVSVGRTGVWVRVGVEADDAVSFGAEQAEINKPMHATITTIKVNSRK